MYIHNPTVNLSPPPRVDAPLQGFTVAVIGRLGKTKVKAIQGVYYHTNSVLCSLHQPELTRIVENLGGKVVSKSSKATTICISDKSESF